MSRKKACKADKMFVDGEQCPLCKGTQFATNWKGRLHILSKEKSEIAKKMGVDASGEYAIKVS